MLFLGWGRMTIDVEFWRCNIEILQLHIPEILAPNLEKAR